MLMLASMIPYLSFALATSLVRFPCFAVVFANFAFSLTSLYPLPPLLSPASPDLSNLVSRSWLFLSGVQMIFEYSFPWYERVQQPSPSLPNLYRWVLKLYCCCRVSFFHHELSIAFFLLLVVSCMVAVLLWYHGGDVIWWLIVLCMRRRRDVVLSIVGGGVSCQC